MNRIFLVAPRLRLGIMNIGLISSVVSLCADIYHAGNEDKQYV
jgi:hypothetical protein